MSALIALSQSPANEHWHELWDKAVLGFEWPECSGQYELELSSYGYWLQTITDYTLLGVLNPYVDLEHYSIEEVDNLLWVFYHIPLPPVEPVQMSLF